MVTIEKSEFGQLNDKRYLSCEGISSLPYGHQDLNAITEFKDSLNTAGFDKILWKQFAKIWTRNYKRKLKNENY